MNDATELGYTELAETSEDNNPQGANTSRTTPHADPRSKWAILHAGLSDYLISRSQVGLDLLNFCVFIADVQSLGPIAFVYFTTATSRGGLGFSTSVAGAIMTVSALFGVAALPFTGAFVDRTRHKRITIAAALFVTSVTYLFLCIATTPLGVGIVMALQGLAGAVYVPAITAISLGMVGYQELPKRTSRNEIGKHFGVVFTGILAIVTVKGNYTSFFRVLGSFALMGLGTIALIRERDIDHAVARGTDNHSEPLLTGDSLVTDAHDYQPPEDDHHDITNHDSNAQGMTVDSANGGRDVSADDNADATTIGDAAPIHPIRQLLVPPVVLFYVSVLLFHMSNAAMLPQIGYKIDRLNVKSLNGNEAVSIASIVAQVIMIIAAPVSAFLATQRWAGSKRVLLAGYSTLIVRGLVFAVSRSPSALLGTQLLDGIAGGAFGVSSVLIVSDLCSQHAPGRFNLMQGTLAGVVVIGASISNGAAGVITDAAGYDVTFKVLAVVGAIGTAVLAITPLQSGLQLKDSFYRATTDTSHL